MGTRGSGTDFFVKGVFAEILSTLVARMASCLCCAQGLKPLSMACVMARLKPCPDTKQIVSL